MDFSAVSAFVQTAELRSFTAAAARLDLTASGVSKAVTRLEADVGVRLLNRTTRSISLTPDGSAFLERCRQVLADLDEAREMLARSGAEPRGGLRISIPVAYGRCVVMPLLVDLLERYGELSIEANVSDRRVDLVEEGFDLAIRIGELPDTRLIARRIDSAVFVVCASPAYLAKAGRPASLEDVAEHACVVARSASSGRTLGWRLARRDGEIEEITPGSRIVVDNGEALIDAALAGAGLVYIHSYMIAEYVSQGRLEVVIDTGASQRIGVFALYPAARQLSPKVRVLVDHLVNSRNELHRLRPEVSLE